MKTEKVKISEVKPNDSNPRIIKDDKFKKLVRSIQEFPQMLEIRPIVVDENNIVLGGNMRLKACKKAGLKEVYIIKASELTEEQKQEFIIKDNVGFGEWDWDMLANEWDAEKLEDWGVDLPVMKDNIEKSDFTDDEFEKEQARFNNQNCELPITPNFHEKHSYFIILCENEIDEQFIRNIFELTQKHTSHKDTDNRLNNVLTVEKIQEAWSK